MKRVLVTGGGGFIGWNCLPRLVARGYEVHAVSTGLHASPGVAWHAANLLQGREAVELVAKVRPTHLLHLAWVVTPGALWTSPLNWPWVDASVTLLRAFGEHGGQRAVFSGTCAEYDPDAALCHERRTPVAPTTVYGASKAALSVAVPAFAAQHGVSSTAWGRLFYLFGPREHPERIVPSAVRSLRHGRPFACTSGTQVRDFLYVEDAADALVTLLDSAVTGAVNIASGTPMPLRTLLSNVGQELGREHLLQFGALTPAAPEPPVLSADVTRLRREVGWSPPTPFDAAVRRTVAWWEQHGDDGASRQPD
jgi:nucleoside-diphosphate-sugar epimerase